MIAVNNRARKLATSLFLGSPASFMENQRAAFGHLLSPPAFRGLFYCRSMPSACSDLPEFYLIENGQPYSSSQSTACSTPGSSPACAREYRTAGSPVPDYRKRRTGSVFPRDDNVQDQIAWLANRKRCCDTCHRDLETEPWFPLVSAGALE